MLPEVLMLLDWAAGTAATVIEPASIDYRCDSTRPHYRCDSTRPHFNADSVRPHYQTEAQDKWS